MIFTLRTGSFMTTPTSYVARYWELTARNRLCLIQWRRRLRRYLTDGEPPAAWPESVEELHARFLEERRYHALAWLSRPLFHRQQAG